MALVPFEQLRQVASDLRNCANGTRADVLVEGRAHLSTFVSIFSRHESTQVSTIACAIQIRLLYANGNANCSFYHDANEQMPSLLSTFGSVSLTFTSAKVLK